MTKRPWLRSALAIVLLANRQAARVVDSFNRRTGTLRRLGNVVDLAQQSPTTTTTTPT